MKSTRYFDDYQSAYNYYGGNVVPSTEIALIGNGSCIFVSSDNAVSGNQQYFDASMTNDEIVDTMTYTAYNNGVAYGTTYGEAIGYTTGHTAGYSEGYSYGYSYGYTEGQAAGGGSMSLEDLTIFERGKFMTELGHTTAHPGYSWEFYKAIDTRWFKDVFDQNPDNLYLTFKEHDTSAGQIVCYKINGSNEVSQVQLSLQAYNIDPAEDPETGDMNVYTVGGYGCFTINLNAGDKVGFYVIFYENEVHYLLTKDAYTDSTTQMTDHWFTASETGTYMMKYEITEYNETDMYYTIEGTFTKVQS